MNCLTCTPEEAAQILGFSLSTVRKKIRNGELPALKTSDDPRARKRISLPSLWRIFW